MSSTNKIEPTELHTFDCSTLSGTFQVIELGGFDYDLAVYKVYNGSSSDILVSYNGVDTKDVFPAGSTLVLDVQANKEGHKAAWPAGRETWVKGSPTVGNLYETGYSIKKA